MHDITFTDISGCSHEAADSLAIVHACKDPCHRHAVDYAGAKSLKPDHPHYLSHTRGHHLYLNLVDPPVPLFKLESFAAFFAFVDHHIVHRPVRIHCNMGQSRAPSLTLLYRARAGQLPKENYTGARAAFEKDNAYKPGKGIEIFLTENWDALMRL